MKKVFAILLIFFSFFTFCCQAKPNTPKVAVFPENSIATLSIFSYSGEGESQFGIKNLGHSFLSIKNTSSSPIILAGKEIAENEEIYFGAWSLSVHFGIWFNVESNYIELYNKYNGRVSVDKGITSEDLEVISAFILNNDTWTPLSNCSKFAINLWNSVALESEKLSVGLINTPSKLKSQLLLFNTHITNKPLSFRGECGYFSDLTNETFEFIGGEIYV